MSWIITDPPQSLRTILEHGLWINAECDRCRRVVALRPHDFERMLAHAGRDLTLDELRRRGKCERPGCPGRVKSLRVESDPTERPKDTRISWDEYRLLKAMRR